MGRICVKKDHRRNWFLWHSIPEIIELPEFLEYLDEQSFLITIDFFFFEKREISLSYEIKYYE